VRSIAPTIACGLLTLAAACSSGPPSTEITTRDSAGVTIIEHPAGAVEAAPLWTVGAATLTIMHGATAEQGFDWIANAKRFPDGRILLIDSQDDGSLVYLFGPDGAFLRQIGRVGMGPGEFVFGRLLNGSAGDTITIYDNRTSRLTWMTTDAMLVGASDLSRFGMGALGTPAGTLADGRFIATSRVFMGDTADHGSSRYRQRMPIVVVDAATPRLDTLSNEIPGAEVKLTAMDMGGETRSVASPVGYGLQTLLVAAGGEVHVASNESSALDTYSLPWALLRSVRFAGARRAVDDEARAALRAAAIANIEKMGAGVGAMKQQFLDMIQRAEIADSMAWYQSMMGAEGGAVWLREMRTVSDSVPHYVIIGEDGKLVARMDLPRASRLLWAGADQVIVALHDEDEVEHVELRPIVTGAAAH